MPSFAAGKERETKEKSPRSTDAVQRLREAHARAIRPVTRTGEREPPRAGGSFKPVTCVCVSPRLAPYTSGEEKLNRVGNRCARGQSGCAER